MLRVTPSFSRLRPAALAVSVVVGACGGRTEDVSAPMADAGDAQAFMVPDAISPEASDSADAASCIIVVAAAYDQSCSLDTDCIAVPQKLACPSSCWNCLFSEAINRSAFPQYQTALMRVFASEPLPCNCLDEPLVACCRSGSCQTVCSTPADVLPACAEVHGACLYNDSFNPPTCDWAGPPNSCAYSDEICCQKI
jgi:hypothetical protein